MKNTLFYLKKLPIPILIIIGTHTLNAQCVAVGPNMCSTTGNDNSSGTIAFTTTSNITSSDNQYSSASVGVGLITNTTSNYLTATGFNYSFPASAEICGIEIQIEKSATSLLGLGEFVRDSRVSLMKNGVLQSTNYATATNWGAETVVTYGGSTDLWGDTWTYDDINNANFGVALSIQYKSILAVAPVARVDNIKVIIYYTINSLLTEGLRRFDVRYGGAQTNITWATSSNSTFKKFIVQRSFDEHRWEEIGNVYPQPEQNDSTIYRYDDHLAGMTGLCYYRLGLLKENNQLEYSAVKNVKLNPEKSLVSIYPNPTSRFISITNPSNNARITLCDLYGNQLRIIRAGMNTQPTVLDVSSLFPGIYVLTIDGTAYRIIRN